MIVKTLELRKNLKQLLEKSEEEDLFLDYYGKLFKITPIKKNAKYMTPTQKLIAKYSNLKPIKLTDPIFNENDSAQEKANFRNLKYGNYDK
jgi:hypothetical protein